MNRIVFRVRDDEFLIEAPAGIESRFLSNYLKAFHVSKSKKSPKAVILLKKGEVIKDKTVGADDIRIIKGVIIYTCPHFGINFSPQTREMVIRWQRQPDSRFNKLILAQAANAALRILVEYYNAEDSFLIHGSSVAIKGRGAAFIGDSGAGKSSLAAMFPVGAVFGDEATFINIKDGKVYLTPTPIRHDSISSVKSINSVPLRAFFYLKQSKRNRINPLGKRKLAKKALATLCMQFLPVAASRRKVFRNLLLAFEISDCYELEFSLDAKARLLIENFIAGKNP